MSLPADDLTVTASSRYDRVSWRSEELTRWPPEPMNNTAGAIVVVATGGTERSIRTIMELGDAASLLSSLQGLISEVRNVVPQIAPELDNELDILSIDRARPLENGSLKKLVLDSLRKLGAPVLDVEIRYGEGIGLYALAILNCGARQALEYWLKIADSVRDYNIPIFVVWRGNIDVTPEEMGAYIGRMLAKMNVFLATREPLDIVKILREEWGI